MFVQVCGVIVVVNLKDWGLSISRYDIEIGPTFVDWEPAARSLNKRKADVAQSLNKMKADVTQSLNKMKADVAQTKKDIPGDIRIIRRLSTGVKCTREGGIATSNVSNTIRYGNGHSTPAGASLPKTRIMSSIAKKLYPEEYEKCLWWMSDQARSRRPF